MAQAPQSDSGSPFPGLILVLAMSAGAFWVQKVPLPSARPAEPKVTVERYAATQNIDSRLWQDPLEAVKNADRKSDAGTAIDSKNAATKSSPKAGASETTNLCDQGPARVLAVMVNGAPYAEAAEARRRTRYAVISGLGRSDYVPVDREHIGHFTTTLNARSGNTQSAGIKTDIPYEWFSNASSKERVLVLWVNETQIRDKPLYYLNQILNPKTCSLQQTHKAVIIGPGSSDTLSAMLCEIQPLIPIDKLTATDKCLGMTSVLPRDFLEKVQIFSPKATVPDETLLQNVGVLTTSSSPSHSTATTTITSQLKNIVEFNRTIATDCALMDTLTQELGKRDVYIDDGIVLISEWDTSYGRTLPKTFESFKENLKKRENPPEEFFPRVGMKLRKTLNETFGKKNVKNKDVANETLWHYSYLRGLDGKLPGENADKKSDENKKAREKSDQEIESAFGNHQKDYLRRIAARVDDLDHEMKDGGKKEGIKAIGILGSDVYDKLLILRALRPHFPEVIFFTTDLDAGLLHAEEWDSARNLVVASGYGLRLNGWLQREIPPFRDSYQTAYFLSVLAALMKSDAQEDALEVVDKGRLEPRIFEIGRSQAVDLSKNVDGPTGGGKCTLESCDSPHPYIDRPTPPNLNTVVAAAVLLLLGGLYYYRTYVGSLLRTVKADLRAILDTRWVRYLGFNRARHDAWYLKTLRLLTSRWVLGVIFMSLLFWWLGWQVHQMWKDIFCTGTAGGGEPFSWYEGVSIWPSALLRIFTGLLALFFLLLSMHRLRRNDERLTGLFFPGYKNIVLFRRRSGASGHAGHACKQKFNFNPDLTSGQKGSKQGQAVLIWRAAVQPRSRIALLGRMVIGVILLMTATFLLVNLLPSEPPNTPFRGKAGGQVHWHSIFFAAVSFIFLLVFVIDSTRRTCCLATCLGDRNATKWPKGTEQRFGHQAQKSLPSDAAGNSRYQDDWLDIQLIAARTVVVGSFIYYPFLILSLIILARSSFFDNLQIPLGLGSLLVMYLLIAIACAMALRHAAERARKHALRNISEEMVRALGDEDRKQQVEQMKYMKESILAEHRGAFASFLQQPWLKALLLPLGSYSGVQLFDSLSLLHL